MARSTTQRTIATPGSAEVAALLFALPPGVYSLRALAGALSRALGTDGALLLEPALSARYLTVVSSHVVDSDGNDLDDRLVSVDSDAILARGVPLPEGTGLQVQPLAVELVVPSPARRRRKKPPP